MKMKCVFDLIVDKRPITKTIEFEASENVASTISEDAFHALKSIMGGTKYEVCYWTISKIPETHPRCPRCFESALDASWHYCPRCGEKLEGVS